MPHEPQTALFNVFGFVLWGDFADLTMYRSKRGKVVWFMKTWPHKAASEKQLTWRALWSTASAAWRVLPYSTRQQWMLAARRASLCLHGYDLWMHWNLTGDDAAIATLEHQTNTQLLPP